MNDVIRDMLGRDVSRETSERLKRFADLLLTENKIQNLVARSTESDLWIRHFADAAQLLAFAPEGASWVDVGSGAGLPGLVVAILNPAPMSLIEPRRLRADFLSRSTAALGLANVTVLRAKAQDVRAPPSDIITARAVASVDRLFAMTAHLSHKGTSWVLPKGRSVQSELDEAQKSWQGEFRLEQSRTDPEAQILIATDVRPKRARGVA